MLITLEPGNISFYFEFMPAPLKRETLLDAPSVIKEVRDRKARFLKNPNAGITWEAAKAKIRAGRKQT